MFILTSLIIETISEYYFTCIWFIIIFIIGLKYNNSNNQKENSQPQLMPPIFTMMYQYMKNKNIKHLTDDDINDFLENNFKQRLPKDYVNLCSKLFNDTDSSYYKIEGIHDRIYPIECKITNKNRRLDMSMFFSRSLDMSMFFSRSLDMILFFSRSLMRMLFFSLNIFYFLNNSPRLLFMNFKSFEILNKDHREKFFKIITETSPDIICLTEALVPTTFTEYNITDLNDYLTDDRIEHPMSDSKTKFAEFKRMLYKTEKTNRKYTEEDDPDIDIDENGNVSLNNVWTNFFVNKGYNSIIFGNPTDCPYGKNWGNCIISKRKPTSCNIIQLDSRKIHKKTTDLVDKNDVESRCMIHITMDEHHILCTHLDDSDSDVRIKQTEQIIEYIKKLPKGKITLVGDLNAINSSSYSESELMLLNKLSINGPLPTDAVDKFNKFFKAFEPQVTLINKGQKYESAFQKCVSHGYSNTYTHSLLIFTDATAFDHQPLLLL